MLSTLQSKTFLVATSILLFTCCREHLPEPVKPDFYFGECTATLNGEPWTACPFAKINRDSSKFFVEADELNSYYSVVRILSLVRVPLEVGTFEFDVFGSEEKPYCLYSYWEYDYSLADYLVPMGTEAKGSVTLDEYDEGTGDLKGTFNCVLYHVSGHGISDAPDSLVFTDGYFHTKILE